MLFLRKFPSACPMTSPSLYKETTSLSEITARMARGYTPFPSCLRGGIRSGCQLFQTPCLATTTLLTRPSFDSPDAWACMLLDKPLNTLGPHKQTAAPYMLHNKAAVSIDGGVCCSWALSGPRMATLMHLQTWRVN